MPKGFLLQGMLTSNVRCNYFKVRNLITIELTFTMVDFLIELASSVPYGPLLARSGYPGQDASFYDNPMVMIVMICATVNALTLL